MTYSNTGTKDEHFNLISTLYHALQSATTLDIYARDAEQAGDRELAQFFQHVKDRNREFAEQAKRLLSQRSEQLVAR